MNCQTEFDEMPATGQAVMDVHNWSVYQASANTKLDLPVWSSRLVTQEMCNAETVVNTTAQQQMLQPADMEWQTHSKKCLLHTSLQL